MEEKQCLDYSLILENKRMIFDSLGQLQETARISAGRGFTGIFEESER